MHESVCLDCQRPPPECLCEGKRYLNCALLQAATGIAQYLLGKAAKSVAVKGDAWHTLVHVVSYCLGIVAEHTVKRLHAQGSREQRIRALFGLGSAATFFAIVALIVIQAFEKKSHPISVVDWLTILGASVGLAGNLSGLKILHPGESLWHHIRDVFHEQIDETHHWLHRDLFFDGLTSLTVLIGSIGNLVIQDPIIDISLSFLVAAMITAGTIYTLVTETFKNL